MLSVLMTTYKERKEDLTKAIESILNQSYSNFKFIIIIDNPDNIDNINIIKEYAEKDSRIHYYINSKNLGLAGSLNKGIEMVDSKYIARMDADDISLPDRFEKQINYLKSNPNVDLIGTNIICIDSEDNMLYKKGNSVISHAKIKKTLKYYDCVYHPTFMGKSSLFKKIKYRNLINCQDYDFLCRAIENGFIINNINDYLLFYRTGNSKEDKSLIYHVIAPYFIKKYYRSNKLCFTDIETLINVDIKKADIYKIKKGENKLNAGIEYYREKKYIQSFFYIFIAFFYTQYHRNRIISLVWAKLSI